MDPGDLDGHYMLLLSWGKELYLTLFTLQNNC